MSPERFDACISVYGTPELVSIILCYSNWETFVAVSNVNTFLRAITHDYFRIHSRSLLSNFVPLDYQKSFWDVLGSTKSIIGGGIVRCMLHIDLAPILRRVYPQELNIIVPASRTTVSNIRRWRNTLAALGYSVHNTNRPVRSSDVFGVHVLQFVTYELSTDGVNRRINLVESSTTSPLPPLLDADNTSSVFAMSATRVYNFYPRLFRRGINYRIGADRTKSFFGHRANSTGPVPLRSFNFGLVTQIEEFGEDGPDCVEACRSAWRSTFDLPMVQVYRWGGACSTSGLGGSVECVSGIDDFEDTKFIWKPDDDLDAVRAEHHEEEGYFGSLLILRNSSWAETPDGYCLYNTEATDPAQLVLVGHIMEEGLFVEPHGDCNLHSRVSVTEARSRFSVARPSHPGYAADFDVAVRNINRICSAHGSWSSAPFLGTSASGNPIINFSRKLFRFAYTWGTTVNDYSDLDDQYRKLFHGTAHRYAVSDFSVRGPDKVMLQPADRHEHMHNALAKIYFQLQYDTQDDRGLVGTVYMVWLM